jgi:hypothetical protein
MQPGSSYQKSAPPQGQARMIKLKPEGFVIIRGSDTNAECGGFSQVSAWHGSDSVANTHFQVLRDGPQLVRCEWIRVPRVPSANARDLFYTHRMAFHIGPARGMLCLS